MEESGTAKLTLRDKLFYSSGYIGIAITEGVIGTFAFYFYNGSIKASDTPRLVPPLLLAAAFLFARIIDSVSDPIVAFFSDNHKSPIGRRVPFLRWFAFPLVLSMIMIFFPPSHGSNVANGVYLLLVLSVFFGTFTAYAAPYLALLPEITSSHEERLGLSSFMAVASLAGTVIGSVVSAILRGIYGYTGMALILGTVSLLFLLLPAFGFDEAKFSKGVVNTEDMLKSMVHAAMTKPFLIYLLSNLGFWFGFNIVRNQIQYMVTNLIGQPEGNITLYLGAVFGMCILFLPVVSWVAKRFGNKYTMLGCMVMDAVVLPCLALLNVPGSVAARSVLGLVLLGLAGIPLAGLLVVPNAIVADITDYDERLTGVRREAMFFAVQGFLSTFSLGFSSLAMIALNSIFGEMGTARFAGPVSGVFIIIAIVIFAGYPEDKVKVPKFSQDGATGIPAGGGFGSI